MMKWWETEERLPWYITERSDSTEKYSDEEALYGCVIGSTKCEKLNVDLEKLSVSPLLTFSTILILMQISHGDISCDILWLLQSAELRPSASGLQATPWKAFSRWLIQEMTYPVLEKKYAHYRSFSDSSDATQCELEERMGWEQRESVMHFWSNSLGRRLISSANASLYH